MHNERDDIYKFKLYIAGETPISVKAINDLRGLLEDDFKDRYFLEIIDVLKNPELAEGDKIFATPTMVKIHPPPVIRIIGDFGDKEKVWLVLLDGDPRVLH